jgi:hypothetical protein
LGFERAKAEKTLVEDSFVFVVIVVVVVVCLNRLIFVFGDLSAEFAR